jgi:glutamine cyclotransferase
METCVLLYQMKKTLLFFPVIVFLISCKNNTSETQVVSPVPQTQESIPFLKYTLISTLPHDTSAYTEGFFIHNGELYESTGSPEYIKHTKSVLGIVDRKSGKINVKIELDRNTFLVKAVFFLKTRSTSSLT